MYNLNKEVSRVEREVVDLLRSMNSGEALPLAQPAPTRFSTQRKSSSGHSRREALSGEAPPGDEAGAAHVGSSAEDLDSSKENLVCSEELSPSDQMPSRLPTQHSMPFTVLRQRQPRRHALSDVTNAEAPSSPFGQRGAGVLLEMARGRGAAQATEAGRGVGNAAGPRPMERWGAKRPRSTDTVLSEEDDTAPSPHDTAARVAATTGPPSVAPPASLRDTAASPMRPRVAGPSGGGSKMTPKTQWRAELAGSLESTLRLLEERVPTPQLDQMGDLPLVRWVRLVGANALARAAAMQVTLRGIEEEELALSKAEADIEPELLPLLAEAYRDTREVLSREHTLLQSTLRVLDFVAPLARDSVPPEVRAALLLGGGRVPETLGPNVGAEVVRAGALARNVMDGFARRARDIREQSGAGVSRSSPGTAEDPPRRPEGGVSLRTTVEAAGTTTPVLAPAERARTCVRVREATETPVAGQAHVPAALGGAAGNLTIARPVAPVLFPAVDLASLMPKLYPATGPGTVQATPAALAGNLRTVQGGAASAALDPESVAGKRLSFGSPSGLTPLATGQAGQAVTVKATPGAAIGHGAKRQALATPPTDPVGRVGRAPAADGSQGGGR